MLLQPKHRVTKRPKIKNFISLVKLSPNSCPCKYALHDNFISMYMRYNNLRTNSSSTKVCMPHDVSGSKVVKMQFYKHDTI